MCVYIHVCEYVYRPTCVWVCVYERKRVRECVDCNSCNSREGYQWKRMGGKVSMK